MSVKERLIEFIKYVQKTDKPNISAFEKSCNLKPAYIKTIRKSIGPDKVQLILDAYPELNMIWLLHNKGKMLISDEGKPAKPETLQTTDRKLAAQVNNNMIATRIAINALVVKLAELEASLSNIPASGLTKKGFADAYQDIKKMTEGFLESELDLLSNK